MNVLILFVLPSSIFFVFQIIQNICKSFEKNIYFTLRYKNKVYRIKYNLVSSEQVSFGDSKFSQLRDN